MFVLFWTEKNQDFKHFKGKSGIESIESIGLKVSSILDTKKKSIPSIPRPILNALSTALYIVHKQPGKNI